MIGKTIAEVIDRSADYGGIDLIFTDGTAVRIEGDGYEDSCVTQSELTPEDRAREAREKAERLEKQRVAAIAQKAREEEEAKVKATLSPEAYEAWMDEHRPGWRFRLIMQDTWRSALLDQLQASSRMLYEVGGAHTTPHTEPPGVP